VYIVEEVEGILKEENLMMFEITSAVSNWVQMIGGSQIWSIKSEGWSSERWKGSTGGGGENGRV
jgi:hypothetical protein